MRARLCVWLKVANLGRKPRIVTVDRVEIKLRQAPAVVQQYCANQTTFKVFPGIAAQRLFVLSCFMG